MILNKKYLYKSLSSESAEHLTLVNFLGVRHSEPSTLAWCHCSPIFGLHGWHSMLADMTRETQLRKVCTFKCNKRTFREFQCILFHNNGMMYTILMQWERPKVIDYQNMFWILRKVTIEGSKSSYPQSCSIP